MPETMHCTVYQRHSIVYFEANWEEQRKHQLDAMDETQKQKREWVDILLELEVRLLVSRWVTQNF